MGIYSIKTGVWKSIQNTLVVLVPAVLASWATFVTNLPPEYQATATAIGGFLGYFVKNYVKNK